MCHDKSYIMSANISANICVSYITKDLAFGISAQTFHK